MDSQPRRILVVDDSPAGRRVAESLLSGADYDVETAASGEEAFESCLNEPFDLLVSDVTMGVLSGVQLCRLLRHEPATADLPIILLTASDNARSRFWGEHAGADDYIAKEDMRTDLIPAVQRLLQSRPAVAGRARVRSPRPRAPLHLLSEILEHHLFQAVVAQEVRRFTEHLDDRKAFARSLVRLASQVADYGYLLLALRGPDGPTYTLHARDPWPPGPEGNAGDFGLPYERSADLDVITSAEPSHDARGASHLSDSATFPIGAADEVLGELRVYGGVRRLTAQDRATLGQLASEVGLVVRSLFLIEETRRLANTDPLTGLYNRRRVTQVLDYEINRAARYAQPLSVMICDLDRFKRINDEFGHPTGDRVLQDVASVLRSTIRAVDAAGRWGGEEFLIVFPGTTLDHSRIAAERIRLQVSNHRVHELGEPVTMTVGLAVHEPGMSLAQLVDCADKALYRGKQRGRNRLEIYGAFSKDK